MALDKEKILNELGSVVNQLQSADCGCMGKLFSNHGQPNNGNMTGRCHCGRCGGPNTPCSGQPCHGPGHCMASCNPPKLYADTYNYLNQNMMQPVMKEVYDDLKSITPQNTIMNNPLATQMGLPAGNPNSGSPGTMGNKDGPVRAIMGGGMHGGMGGNMESDMGGNMGGNMRGNMGGNMGGSMAGNTAGNMAGNMTGNMAGNIAGNMAGNLGGNYNNINHQHNHNTNMSRNNTGGNFVGNMGGNYNNTNHQYHHNHNTNMSRNNTFNGNPTPQTMGMANMNGMGPQIMNMISGDGKTFNGAPNQGGDPSNLMGNMPQASPTGAMGGTILGQRQFASSVPSYNGANPGSPILSQGMQGNQMNPAIRNSPHQVMYTEANPNTRENIVNGYSNQIPESQPAQYYNVNPAQLQRNPPKYGQHNAGMTKFNDMFPGVTQGDLGFDPMSIAYQMNPANQQQSAMNTMKQQLMKNSDDINRIMDSGKMAIMKAVTDATNTAAAQITQGQINRPSAQTVGQQDYVPNTVQQQQLQPHQLQPHQLQPQQLQPQQQQVLQQQPIISAPGAIPNQISPNQVYTYTYNDPNTKISLNNMPPAYEGTQDPNAPQHQPPSPAGSAPGQMLEPIIPADISKVPVPENARIQTYSHYNTLGQPVDMVPSHKYHQYPSNWPQTLGPPSEYRKNIKSTVSKTSIMDKTKSGRTPSRSHLQHLYNQYKGSQSSTQQNINQRNYTQYKYMYNRPERGPSYSEGNLNATQQATSTQLAIPSPQEKIGMVTGDTAANNSQSILAPINEQMTGVGDIPIADKPMGEGEKIVVEKKYRNGLQDIVYTSYPTSTCWSFHGDPSYKPGLYPLRSRRA